MASIGDTAWGQPDVEIPPYNFSISPEDNATEIEVALSQLSALATINEYYDAGGGAEWRTAHVQPVTVNSAQLIESPAIDDGTIVVSQPLPWSVRTIVPINSDLAGGTEHTWKIRINVTHNTDTFGMVTRSYDSPEFTFTTLVPDGQVLLSSPDNGAIDVRMDPTLSWTVNGGEEDGDFFFIYLRKDDSNFTDDDLLQGFRTSLNIKVLYGLEYNTTYYWQVQAARVGGGLFDSVIWSFTTVPFYPPTVSTRLKAGNPVPTGENNQLTVRRLIAAAQNKIFYEDV